MALSDCPKCWDTPCGCGYMYRDYSIEARTKLASAIFGEEEFSLMQKDAERYRWIAANPRDRGSIEWLEASEIDAEIDGQMAGPHGA